MAFSFGQKVIYFKAGDDVLHTALKLLQIIEDHGYKAYIVGGFVRNYLLGIESNDIDITTSATPKQIKEIFKDACLPHEEYGSIRVIMKKVSFEITTFRRERDYFDKRRPSTVEFTTDLLEDLSRRDFTMNTLCMDKSGTILDLLGGKEDILNRRIQTVGNSLVRFEEDSLRILRAVRFATTLDFDLSESVIKAIKESKHLLKFLSYERKKDELDKIFASKNVNKGIKLLLDLGLDQDLELVHLKDMPQNLELIAIWAYLDVIGKYPFTVIEKSQMQKIKEVLKEDIKSPKTLYHYGLYICRLASPFQNISPKEITSIYENLPIHKQSDLDITSEEIMAFLNRSPGSYLREIYRDLEENVIKGTLENNKTKIYEYLQKYLQGGEEDESGKYNGVL